MSLDPAALISAATREQVQRASILDSVPLIDRSLSKPAHCEKLARLIRRAHNAACGNGPRVLACYSQPPQTGKTSTLQCAAAWWLARNPDHFLGYVTYGQSLADEKSRGVRRYVSELGIELLEDTRAVDLWRTKAGGGLLARGRDAGITGHSALTCVFVDDPYRNRIEAESRHLRSRVLDDFRSTIWTRLHPRSSLIVLHTRWRDDDLIGTLERDGWEIEWTPAVDESGSPLWPESGRDAAFWADARKGAGEYAWWSLYQQRPRAREGRLFKGVTYYTSRPHDLRIAIGVDLAYSTRSAADWSVIVVAGLDSADRLYVLDVVRRQCSAPELAFDLRAILARYPGAPIHAIIGGTELGVVDFFATQRIHINAISARYDKHTRAIAVSEAWEAGRVMVPQGNDGDSPAWVEPLVSEILDFTGDDGAHDDQVDALVSVFDALVAGRVDVPKRPHGFAPARPQFMGNADNWQRAGSSTAALRGLDTKERPRPRRKWE